MLSMSEAQAFISFPTFLAKAGDTQFRTRLGGASRHRRITCRPEAIQHFLRTYASASAMRKVLEHLRNIGQVEKVVKEEYEDRLNQTVFRCGNVHRENEKIAVYIDNPFDIIRTVVACYCESVHRRELTFESLAHFAKSEDEPYCAQRRQIARRRLLLSATGTAIRTIPRPHPQDPTRNASTELISYRQGVLTGRTGLTRSSFISSSHWC